MGVVIRTGVTRREEKERQRAMNNATPSLGKTLVICYEWEPKQSAAYAEFDRAISASLAGLVKRSRPPVPPSRRQRSRLPQRKFDDVSEYIGLLGQLVREQSVLSMKTEPRPSWLTRLVTVIRHWISRWPRGQIAAQLPWGLRWGAGIHRRNGYFRGGGVFPARQSR